MKKAANNCKCKVCGKEFHVKPSQIIKGRGKHCSIKCRGISQAKRMIGVRDKKYGLPLNLNPNWKGGKSFEDYPLGWNNTFKEQIRYRDQYRCQICGMPEIENSRRLDVHHIDYDKDNINKTNLISLCISCHRKTNFNREYWKQYFHKEVMPHAQP